MSAAPRTGAAGSEAPAAFALDECECEREPIRTPAAIQPHGAMLIVAELNLQVLYASRNVPGYVGRSLDDVLGRSLVDLLGDELVDTMRPLLEDTGSGRPVRVELPSGRAVDMFAHRVGERVVIEFEQLDGAHAMSFGTFQDDVRDALLRFERARDVETLLELAVGAVYDLSGFDRVLAYRFEPDGHGVVVKERRTEGLEPFLGLHYPASDIPAQARALYREQWLRLIPDSSARAVDLIGLASAPAPSAIDLGAAVLRAVSPVHLEYLRNMGVRSSMSISLIVDSALWGLIVCHHYAAPRTLPYAVRAVCEIVGMTASMTIGGKEQLAMAEQRVLLDEIGTRLLEQVALTSSIAGGLVAQPELLLGLANASGAAVRLDGDLQLVGSAPPRELLGRIVEIADERLGAVDWYATEALAIDYPELVDVSEWASGVLAIRLSDGHDLVLWFRPERVRTVAWAGDPEKAAQPGQADPTRIGPRRSFAQWAETVRGRSERWGRAEIEAVRAVRGSLSSSLERARLYEREHSVAEVIREGLRPSALPLAPGLDIDALYLPAGDGFGVSGDFYDVFPVAGGWIAAIGDVCGKGPRAARLTALARHTIRAVALHDPSVVPSRMMSVLNEAFLQHAPDMFASVQIARVALHEDGRRFLVQLSSAGHPPALHRHGLVVTPCTSRNIVVGVQRALGYAEVSLVLEAGDSLVLYTDGITEAGRPVTLFGERRLAEVVAEAPNGSARGIIDAIELAVRAAQTGELRDDIAVLALRNGRS